MFERLTARSRRRKRARRLSLDLSPHGYVEPLETRRLLSATAELIRDINPGAPSSFPSAIVEVGEIVYFSAHANANANNGTIDNELWKSDGTTAGTVLVKDIYAGAVGSNPGSLTNVGGVLYFRAGNGPNSNELWKSDGTEVGTVLVKDINAGAGWSNPNFLTNLGGVLYFSADNGTNGRELWKCDGTEAGTVLVKDINPGADDSSPEHLINVGGVLYFIADNGTNGRELWKSDGTEAGTVLVKDINAGAGYSILHSLGNHGPLTNVGGVLYFQADNGANGYELWRSDGTEAGTALVKDINPGTAGSSPGYLTDVGGVLYFRADNGTNGHELWKSDGTEAGTVLVKDINLIVKDIHAGAGSSSPNVLTNMGGVLYFIADNGTNGRELWKSDGTTTGTVLVKDINPAPSIFGPSSLTNVGGVLYFRADNGTNGPELWKSDGTTAGTVLVQDFNPGAAGSFPAGLTNVGGVLYFQATDGTNGVELWKLAPFSLPFSDNFNRANDTSLGLNWIETLGNLGITNQRVGLYQDTESTAVLTNNVVADVSVSADVDLSTAEVGRSIALMARAQGPGDANAYWGVYYRSDSGYAAQIYKHTGGSPIALRSVNVSGPIGNLRFEAIGTTLNLYFNNTLVTSVIDDTLRRAGAVGVRQTGGTFDNFAAVAAVPPLTQNATLPFSDNFNRPDSSLFGTFWTERSGDTGVRNNGAGMYANDTSVVTLNGIFETDVSVSADIDLTGVPAQFSSGLFARYSGPGDTNTYMARLFRSDSGNFAAQIWKNVGGQYTPLRSVFVPSGAGNLRFDVVGDQLQLFFNNILVASTIDSSIPGPGQVGMRLLGGTIDNFSTAEMVAPPVSDATLPFLDDFNRAESFSLGEFWTERAGDIGVRNQRMELFAGEQSMATLNGISESDIEVAADIDITAGGNAGLLARYTGPGDSNAYLGLLQPADGGTFAAQIWKNTGTGWQNLTHTQVGAGAGRLAFVLNGNHLQLYFEENLVGDVIDGSIPGPGTVGVRQGGGTIDNFEAEVPFNMIRDINPLGPGSEPSGLVQVGETVYFSANNGTNGRELWKSDGTTAGTMLVKDINAGAGNSDPRFLTNVGGVLYFRAFDSTNGNRLWKSDGSEAGTVLVKDINAESVSSPISLTNVGGVLYFQANNGTNGGELWKSDGTEAGTMLVKDIRAGAGSSNPSVLSNVGGVLYFRAYDETNGIELWKSDGTEAGTVLVKDINPGAGHGNPDWMVNVGGVLYFQADNGTNGTELWKSDGTEAGTVLVKDLGTGTYSPGNLTNVGGVLYFYANNGTNGRELWKSDGTEAGTVLVKEIRAGTNGSDPTYLTNVGGVLYFVASNDTNGRELWKSDGTESGTVLVKDINAGTGRGDPKWLTNVGGVLYFQANNGTNGVELWKSDGTTAGTVLVQDINAGAGHGDPSWLSYVGDLLYFSATDGVHGEELWTWRPS